MLRLTPYAEYSPIDISHLPRHIPLRALVLLDVEVDIRHAGGYGSLESRIFTLETLETIDTRLPSLVVSVPVFLTMTPAAVRFRRAARLRDSIRLALVLFSHGQLLAARRAPMRAAEPMRDAKIVEHVPAG